MGGGNGRAKQQNKKKKDAIQRDQRQSQKTGKKELKEKATQKARRQLTQGSVWGPSETQNEGFAVAEKLRPPLRYEMSKEVEFKG